MKKIIMNNVVYKIKEVEQNEMLEWKNEEPNGYYYGQTHFMTQEIWIDNSLSFDKKRKTLIHELTHVYIREYLTSAEINYSEEDLCDIAANSHDIIHQMVEDYFRGSDKE